MSSDEEEPASKAELSPSECPDCTVEAKHKVHQNMGPPGTRYGMGMVRINRCRVHRPVTYFRTPQSALAGE